MVVPGFRFCPTDEELVMYYLKNKVLGKKHFQVIGEICIYRYAPWDLPKESLLRTGDLKWYFFCPIRKNDAGNVRINRSTGLGFWKTSGDDRKVHHKTVAVGTIRTLIFYEGKSPNGVRTDWVMHEYKLEGKEWAEKGIAQDRYALCVIFKKDGLGPANGAQYGAPFGEEDWYIEEEEELEDRALLSSIGVSTLAFPAQDIPITSHVLINYAPENMTWPPVHHTVVPDTNASTEASQIAPENDHNLWQDHVGVLYGGGWGLVVKAASESSSSEFPRKLDQTPTWTVARVCAVFIIISLLLELLLHKLGAVLFYFFPENFLF